MAVTVSLVELSDENREAALALRVAPGQERFVGGSVRDALADAAEYPHAKPWYRVVCAGSEPVGFVPTGESDVNGEAIVRLGLT
jgi:diamine N-acetyltransferase